MSSCIIRLRGLPWSASEEDIRAFLGEPAPDEIFLRKRGEKSTGEAFAEYKTPQEASRAQEQCNNRNLGERYIEIFPTDADSLQILKDEVQEQDTGWVVRLRGLPFSATPEDVLAFFSGLEVLRGPAGVVFTWGRDGRPLGEAYVEFPSEAVQLDALKRDREKMGPRYVEIFKSTKADMIMRAALRFQRRSSDSGSLPSLYQTRDRPFRRLSEPGSPHIAMQPVVRPFMSSSPLASLLRLRGAAHDATAESIAHFFSEFGVRSDAVEILKVPTPTGQLISTGQANIRFASPILAESALRSKNGKNLGKHTIECFLLAPQMQSPFVGPPALYAAPTPPFIAQGMNPMGMMVGMQELPARPPATPPSPQPSTMSGRMQGVHQRSGGPQATPQSPAQASPVRNPAQPPIQPGVGPMGSPFLSPLSAQQRNPARNLFGSPTRMPPGSPQSSYPPFPPAAYQQQMYMQQYLMHQHYLQQQAMSQQAGWGLMPGQGMGPVPMNFAAPYPGSPLRPLPGSSQFPPQRPTFAARWRGPGSRSSTPIHRKEAARSTSSADSLFLGALTLASGPQDQPLQATESPSEPLSTSVGFAPEALLPPLSNRGAAPPSTTEGTSSTVADPSGPSLSQ